MTAIAAVIGSLAVIFSVDYMHGDEQLGRYYFLVLFFIGAMTGLVLSGNLLFTFFFWEITALCSYGLISFYNDDPKAVAGGIKALIITQVGGVGLLAGTLIAFANLGSFQISDLLAKASTLPAAALVGDRVQFPDRRRGKIGAVPIPHLAAGCHGSADAGQRVDPCRDDGQCRDLFAGAFLSCL